MPSITVDGYDKTTTKSDSTFEMATFVQARRSYYHAGVS